MHRAALALLIPCAVACGPAAHQASYGRNVFGRDDRTELDLSRSPWSALGKVFFDQPGYCTGFLVASDLVVTNRHCVNDETGRSRGHVRFVPAYASGAFKHLSYAHRIWTGTDPGTTGDWAVLRLSAPLAIRYGVLPLRAGGYRFSGAAPALALAAFSGDRSSGEVATVHTGCAVHEREGMLLHHDCDMTRGASGGPVIVTDAEGSGVVGLNAGEGRGDSDSSYVGIGYQRAYANVALDVATIEPVVRRLSANDEGKPVEAVVNICNSTSYAEIRVAFAFKDRRPLAPEGMVARGWTQVKRGRCAETSAPRERGSDLHVYAEAEADGRVVWTTPGGTASFCISRSGSNFETRNLEGGACRPTERAVSFETRTTPRDGLIELAIED